MSKALLLLSAVLLFMSPTMQAQINAGDVPAGMSIFDPGINWSLHQSSEDSARAVDIDCDGNPDLNFILNTGAPAIDNPHRARIEILNPAFEICMDTIMWWGYERPEYYNLNDLMDCSTGVAWVDSMYLMGDAGGWSVAGPQVVTDQHIAFRKGSQHGWVKVSFDITSTSPSFPVLMDINEIIQFCAPSGVNDFDQTLEVSLAPNPTIDGIIQVESDVQIVRVEVVNITGQIVVSESGTIHAIRLPSAPGIYFVKLETATGLSAVRKVVRR
jgi:hypothetical protein